LPDRPVQAIEMTPALMAVLADLLCEYEACDELPDQFAERMVHAVNKALVQYGGEAKEFHA
jgi:hypothetical protein